MSCQQMLTITYATSGLLQESYPLRIDVYKEEIHEKLKQLESSGIDEEIDEPEKD